MQCYIPEGKAANLSEPRSIEVRTSDSWNFSRVDHSKIEEPKEFRIPSKDQDKSHL